MKNIQDDALSENKETDKDIQIDNEQTDAVDVDELIQLEKKERESTKNMKEYTGKYSEDTHNKLFKAKHQMEQQNLLTEEQKNIIESLKDPKFYWQRYSEVDVIKGGS